MEFKLKVLNEELYKSKYINSTFSVISTWLKVGTPYKLVTPNKITVVHFFVTWLLEAWTYKNAI